MEHTKTVDQLSRPLRDLRISVIDRCNFRCQYCMPAEIFDNNFSFLPKEELLSYEEIVRVASIFAELGVKKIRLTGGEPLLRKNLSHLIEKLNKISGIEDLALTTNGVLLEKHAVRLKEAGLQRVNVSLDSIDDELFKKINGRNVSNEAVLKGIRAAKEAGLEVKVNMVVKRGLNEHQILPMAQFCLEENVQLRFIEYMDVGSTNGWKMDHVITKKEILELLQTKYSLKALDEEYYGEVAKRYRYESTLTEIGFITSVSHSFCSNCTRARISADGKIYTCLFNGKGHDVKTILRSQPDDLIVENYVKSIWNKRDDRYSDDRSKGINKQREKIEMSYIGG